MTIEIEFIASNEKKSFKGDVHIKGNIGAGATIEVIDGDLIIDGQIGDNSEIKLKTTGGVINRQNKLQVMGNIGERVYINSYNADFNISGNLGANCVLKTHNGDIEARNLGENVSLTTLNGDIQIYQAARNVSLTSHNGNIHAEVMTENSIAITHNGNVNIKKAHESVEVATQNGKAYKNGQKVKSGNEQGASFIYSGNIISSSGIITVQTFLGHRKTDEQIKNELVTSLKQYPADHKLFIDAAKSNARHEMIFSVLKDKVREMIDVVKTKNLRGVYTDDITSLDDIYNYLALNNTGYRSAVPIIEKSLAFIDFCHYLCERSNGPDYKTKYTIFCRTITFGYSRNEKMEAAIPLFNALLKGETVTDDFHKKHGALDNGELSNYTRYLL